MYVSFVSVEVSVSVKIRTGHYSYLDNKKRIEVWSEENYQCIKTCVLVGSHSKEVLDLTATLGLSMWTLHVLSMLACVDSRWDLLLSCHIQQFRNLTLNNYQQERLPGALKLNG